MSVNITKTFTTDFDSRVNHTLQQRASKTKGRTLMKTGVVGESTKFPVLGTSDVVTNRARHTSLFDFIDDIDHTSVTCSLNNKEVPQVVDSLDEMKQNFNVKQGYAESVAMSLGREVDLVSYTAMDAAATLSAPAIMDEAKLRELNQFAYDNNWDGEEEDWWLAVTPAVHADMLAIDKVVNSDYSNDRGVNRGTVLRSYGFNIITTSVLNSLVTSPTEHKCFAWTKNAFGVAWGRMETTKIGFDIGHNATVIVGEMSLGACIIKSGGVVEIPITT